MNNHALRNRTLNEMATSSIAKLSSVRGLVITLRESNAAMVRAVEEIKEVIKFVESETGNNMFLVWAIIDNLKPAVSRASFNARMGVAITKLQELADVSSQVIKAFKTVPTKEDLAAGQVVITLGGSRAVVVAVTDQGVVIECSDGSGKITTSPEKLRVISGKPKLCVVVWERDGQRMEHITKATGPLTAQVEVEALHDVERFISAYAMPEGGLSMKDIVVHFTGCELTDPPHARPVKLKHITKATDPYTAINEARRLFEVIVVDVVYVDGVEVFL